MTSVLDDVSSYADGLPFSVPPNVRFEVDDVEEDWLYSRPFDYIHLRFMNGSLVNWKKLITKAYK